MPITGNFNPSAMGSTRHMARATELLARSQQRLASGLRINDPSDDPASAAISNVLSSDVAVLTQASQNASTGSNVVAYISDALSNYSQILTRMKSIAAQSNSAGVSDTERGMLNTEFLALKAQLEDIANNTKWLSSNLLDGTGGSLVFQVGLASDATITVSTIDVTTDHADIALAASVINNQAGAAAAVEAITVALSNVSGNIASFAAIKSRLRYVGDVLSSEILNKAAAKSSFADADVTVELMSTKTAEGLAKMSAAMFEQALRKQGDVAALVEAAAR
jgi:flagellin